MWTNNGLHKECSNQINNLPLFRLHKVWMYPFKIGGLIKRYNSSYCDDLKWRYKKELVQPPYNLPSYMLKATTLQNSSFL